MIELTTNFIDLNWLNVMYLFFVGLVGGLVSGFIGSGGAFVLTPGMMSIKVLGLLQLHPICVINFLKHLWEQLKELNLGRLM